MQQSKPIKANQSQGLLDSVTFSVSLVLKNRRKKKAKAANFDVFRPHAAGGKKRQKKKTVKRDGGAGAGASLACEPGGPLGKAAPWAQLCWSE